MTLTQFRDHEMPPTNGPHSFPPSKDQKIEVEKSQEKRLELNLAVRSM